jgi:glucosamine--fructose-6-phosphate aminotransferase (isomerizing)
MLASAGAYVGAAAGRSASGRSAPARVRDNRRMSLRSEIGEAPAVVRRLVESAPGALVPFRQAASRRPPRFVVIAARGTSDHAALYAQYVLGSLNRLPVALATPSLTTVYGTPPRLGDALVIGISQSGRSPDVVGVVADAREQGALTLAVTNDPASELGDAAEYRLDLATGPEEAVAATKTYVAQLAAVALLSAALPPDGAPAGAGPGDHNRSIAGIADALERALESESDVAAVAADGGPDACVVLGRGFQYPTAREWSLKLKEVAGILADPYSAADFEHGPITLVGPELPVLAVATTGAAVAGVVALLERLRGVGADLLVASDDDEVRGLGRRSLPLPPGVPEWLAPIVSIVPAQLYAYHAALARGVDPERPRHLRKVTLTT